MFLKNKEKKAFGVSWHRFAVSEIRAGRSGGFVSGWLLGMFAPGFCFGRISKGFTYFHLHRLAVVRSHKKNKKTKPK